MMWLSILQQSCSHNKLGCILACSFPESLSPPADYQAKLAEVKPQHTPGFAARAAAAHAAPQQAQHAKLAQQHKSAQLQSDEAQPLLQRSNIRTPRSPPQESRRKWQLKGSAKVLLAAVSLSSLLKAYLHAFYAASVGSHVGLCLHLPRFVDRLNMQDLCQQCIQTSSDDEDITDFHNSG